MVSILNAASLTFLPITTISGRDLDPAMVRG